MTLTNAILTVAGVLLGMYIQALRDAARRRKNLALPDRRWVWLVVYQDTQGLGVFQAYDISDLDGSLSGLDMDGGRVIFVLDRAGNRVSPDGIGSHQVGMF